MKKALIYIIGFVALIYFVLAVTDNTYLYKAIVYNYVNIDDNDLFSQRVIEKDKSSAWAFSKNYNTVPLPERLDSALQAYESVAFLIIKNDSIEHEHYWDGYGISSLSNSFSMAKSIISILVGIAIDEGHIKSLDQSIGDFLPEYNEGKKKKVTIGHLLMMASGLNWDESYGSAFSVTTKAYYGTDLFALVKDLEPEEEPGNVYRYKSGNTQLLAFILENATGKSVSDYASEKLWIPLHAERNAEWSLDTEDGMEKAYCCFYSNARDFARIGKLYLNGGNFNGIQVVSADYVTQSIVPNAAVTPEKQANTHYGLHWWLMNRKGYDIFYARGILGQYIIGIPELNLVVVRLGHKRSEVKENFHVTDVLLYIDEVLNMYTTKN